MVVVMMVVVVTVEVVVVLIGPRFRFRLLAIKTRLSSASASAPTALLSWDYRHLQHHAWFLAWMPGIETQALMFAPQALLATEPGPQAPECGFSSL